MCRTSGGFGRGCAVLLAYAAAARRHGVTLVVNCTRNLPPLLQNVTHLRVPVDDTPDDAER